MRSELQIVSDELRIARQELFEERHKHSLHRRLEEQAVQIMELTNQLAEARAYREHHEFVIQTITELTGREMRVVDDYLGVINDLTQQLAEARAANDRVTTITSELYSLQGHSCDGCVSFPAQESDHGCTGCQRQQELHNELFALTQRREGK